MQLMTNDMPHAPLPQPDLTVWRDAIAELNDVPWRPGSIVFSLRWPHGRGALGMCLQAVMYGMPMADRLRLAAEFSNRHRLAASLKASHDPGNDALVPLLTADPERCYCPACGEQAQDSAPGWTFCPECSCRFEIVVHGNGVAARDRFRIDGFGLHDRIRDLKVAIGTSHHVGDALYHLMNRGEPVPAGMLDHVLLHVEMGFTTREDAEANPEGLDRREGLLRKGANPLSCQPRTKHGSEIRRNLRRTKRRK